MKFVIFDIDGTLTKTVAIDDLCFGESMMEVFDIDPKLIDWEAVKAKTSGTDSAILDEIVHDKFGRFPTKKEREYFRKDFVTRLANAHRRQPNEFAQVPGASEILRNLMNNENNLVGIATGSWSDSAKVKLRAAGVHHNPVLLGSSDIHGQRKDIISDLINKAKSRYGLECFEKIIYVGDGEWDFLSSNMLGIDFVGVDHEGNGKLRSLGASRVVNDYNNFEEFISYLD